MQEREGPVVMEEPSSGKGDSVTLEQEAHLGARAVEAWNMDLLAVAMMNGPAEARKARWGTMEAAWGQFGLKREVCQGACDLGPGNMKVLDVVVMDPAETAVVDGTEVGVFGNHVTGLANSLAGPGIELAQEVELTGGKAIQVGLQACRSPE